MEKKESGETTESTFFTDYSALQAELENPTKDTLVDMTLKSGRRVKYSYTQLPDLLASVKPVVLKHNFILINNIVNKQVVVSLVHKSTRDISASIDIPEYGTDAQALGSFLSYARRYLTLAVLNIAQEDDDGVATTPNSSQNVPRNSDTTTSAKSVSANTATKTSDTTAQNFEPVFVRQKDGTLVKYEKLAKFGGLWFPPYGTGLPRYTDEQIAKLVESPEPQEQSLDEAFLAKLDQE